MRDAHFLLIGRWARMAKISHGLWRITAKCDPRSTGNLIVPGRRAVSTVTAGAHFPSRRGEEAELAWVTGYLHNKSVFSYLRTLTTWHCPHSPAALRCCSNRSISPARRVHSSKPAAASLLRVCKREGVTTYRPSPPHLLYVAYDVNVADRQVSRALVNNVHERGNIVAFEERFCTCRWKLKWHWRRWKI